MMGTEVQFGTLRRSVDRRGSWPHSNVKALTATEHLKVVKMINFIFCILAQFKKNPVRRLRQAGCDPLIPSLQEPVC